MLEETFVVEYELLGGAGHQDLRYGLVCLFEASFLDGGKGWWTTLAVSDRRHNGAVVYEKRCGFHGGYDDRFDRVGAGSNYRSGKKRVEDTLWHHAREFVVLFSSRSHRFFSRMGLIVTRIREPNSRISEKDT